MPARYAEAMSEDQTTVRTMAPWKRMAMLSAGVALLPIGLIVMPLPGPLGIPLMALGVVLIVTASRRAAGWVRLHRKRWDWMHEILERGETWIGGSFGHALRRTNGRGARVPVAPLPWYWRIVDMMLLPIHIAIAVGRSLARRFGWIASGGKGPPAPTA